MIGQILAFRTVAGTDRQQWLGVHAAEGNCSIHDRKTK